jgi:hypothetical protein
MKGKKDLCGVVYGKNKAKKKRPKRKCGRKNGPKASVPNKRQKGECGPKHRIPHTPFYEIPLYIIR